MGNVSIVCGDYRNTLREIVSRIQPPATNLCKLQKNEVRRISFSGNYTCELICPMNCSGASFVAHVSGVILSVKYARIYFHLLQTFESLWHLLGNACE